VTTEHHPNREFDLNNELAAKPFFKIGEVAKLVGVKPHVIRYWETEFPSLTPKKNPSGQRIYVKGDIEAIVEIKNLLYNERYTISGARQMLDRQKEGVSGNPPAMDTTRVQALVSLRELIDELLTLLERKPIL
jgi:DNA-binding transcriptional MerR regulator